MSNITASIRATPSAGNPTITNLTLTLANTEYSHTFTSAVQKFLIRARGASRLQISFISGNTNTIFTTIPKGTALSVGDLNYAGTVYIEGNIAGDIVEILSWT